MRRTAASLSGLLLVVLGAVVSAAQPEASPEVTERRRAERLQELEQRIVRSERALEAAQRQVLGLSGQLRETRLELELRTSLAEEAQLRLLDAQIALADSEERRLELEGRVSELRTALGRRLAALARYGSGGYLRLLFSIDAQQGDDLRPALRLLRYLVRQDGRALDRYLEASRALDDERRRLESRRQSSAQWLAEETERAEALQRARARQQAMLDRALRQQESAEDRARDLELRRERLESLVALLASEDLSGFEGRRIEDFKGALDWPIEGEVTIPFGPRRDPVYGTQVPHNGVALECSAPSPDVARPRAVFGGRVRYAAPFKGFGNTVIVQHPERVFTLYAGLRDLRVEVEDVVGLGAILGSCDTSLYLEFRAGSKAEDPRLWLR